MLASVECEAAKAANTPHPASKVSVMSSSTFANNADSNAVVISSRRGKLTFVFVRFILVACYCELVYLELWCGVCVLV